MRGAGRSKSMSLCPYAASLIFLAQHATTPHLSLRLGTDFTVVPLGSVTGELRIKGPSVFQEYIGNAKATREEFDEDGRRLQSPFDRWVRSVPTECLTSTQRDQTVPGFFKTGDIAEYDATLDAYAIVGRASVDIIKSGG